MHDSNQSQRTIGRGLFFWSLGSFLVALVCAVVVFTLIGIGLGLLHADRSDRYEYVIMIGLLVLTPFALLTVVFSFISVVVGLIVVRRRPVVLTWVAPQVLSAVCVLGVASNWGIMVLQTPPQQVSSPRQPPPSVKYGLEWAVAAKEYDWTPADPQSMNSLTQPIQFEKLDDKSILVRDAHVQKLCEIELLSDIEQVTALRIDALNDPSLPDGGPGRGYFGRFRVNKVEASVQSRVDGGPVTNVDFRDGVASGMKPGNSQAMVAGNGEWFGSGTSQHSLILTIAKPISCQGGTRLRVVLTSHTTSGESLGKFQISVSDSVPGTVTSAQAN
jgi:hypothetical protein